jgi:signal transduction histidine kinase/ActR/RegA family two-component response regulator
VPRKDLPSITELLGDRSELVHALLAHTRELVWVLDGERRVLWTNRPDLAPVGEPATSAFAEASRPRFASATEVAVGSARTAEVDVTTAQAARLHLRVVPMAPVGSTACLLVVGTDVTGKKLAEDALQTREQQLGMALEASGMGQWTWNVARDEVTWDAATRRLFQFDPTREDITYDTFLSRLHPDDVERVKHHVGVALETGRYDALESRIVLPDGSKRWALMTGRVLQDDTGAPTDLIGGIVDLTQTKTNDALLKRTEKLEAIGQLAGGIAHDFNNLLVAIMGNVELGNRSASESQRQAYLSEALLACSRAADLTRQLLAFGRRQQLHETALDLASLITDTMKLLRRLLPESINIKLERGVPRALVQGDRGQLEQVLINLCVNARDAMPDGGQLTIRVHEEDVDHREDHPWARPGRHAVVSVRDTGAGIAPELMNRLFEPFFTTKAHGTGLGLASAYGIVKHHGGVLRVESRLGSGATFAVFLPSTTGDAIAPETQVPAEIRGGAETILVAEDEPAVSYVVARILEGAGYDVLTAEDGVLAVDLFRQERDRVALVLLDSVMPRLSGPEVAVRVRELRPNVGIILSSGYSDALAQAPADPTIDDVLPKPYEPDQLLAAVRHVLDSRARRAAR